jgi:general nucleoside transport system permease protein
MEFLYGIPILGVLIQLVVYLAGVIPPFGYIILGSATPLALGALCGIMNERSGVVNIGIEGTMLMAAFFAFLVGATVSGAFPTEPSGLFGATPALVIGVLAGVLTGVLVSALHAWLSITLRTDQIISGTIINIAGLGVTGYLNRLIIGSNPRAGAGTFAPFEPASGQSPIPVVGWIFDMFLKSGPIAMSVIVLVVILQILMFRSRWGLRTRAVGEHPRAADTVGIDVIALRYRNVLAGGIFAGLAGAYLTLEANSSFQNGMTDGRGFIALACVIFGRWTPLGAFGAALLFATSDVLGSVVQLRPPTGDLVQLGSILHAIPPEFFSALPYIVTIIVLAGVVGRSTAPAAVGQPYEKESQAT